MITSDGKMHIKRYLAGYVPSIAGSMAFGIGSQAEALGDSALQLQVESSVINLTSYDFTTNQLVYKAAIPETYIGKIYEVGIYSLTENPTSAEYASRLITTFDSLTETWEDSSGNPATFSTASTRVGADSLQFVPGASASTTYNQNEIELDLSGYSSADTFTMAYNVGNANTSQIIVRFYTDTGNYYATNLGAQTAGYKIVTVTKGAFTVTGTPTWSNITKIQIVVTSGSGGASAVDFDAIRVNDVDSVNTDYILVARKVLAVPETVIEGMAQDMEFRLDVSIP